MQLNPQVPLSTALRPALAVLLAPLLFVVMLYTIGFLGLVMGIVSP